VNRAGSSAKGQYQMIDGTWNQFLASPANGGRYNNTHRFDRAAQDDAAKWYVGEIDKTLMPVLGRPPSDQEVKASWMLGPGAMKAFLSADPNADAFSVYAGVTNPDTAAKAFSQNGNILRRGATVAETLRNVNSFYAGQPRGPGVAGGTNNPVPQGTDTSAPMPPPDPATTKVDAADGEEISRRMGTNGNLKSPDATSSGPEFFTPQNMLRLAAGFLSGKTAMQSMGNAASLLSQGMTQDQQMAMQQELLGIRRRGADLDERKANASIVSEAAKVAELTGMPMAAALELAGGQMPQGMASDILSKPVSGGRRTQGELFIAPDGSYYRENQRAHGPSVFTNTATGQDTPTLPQGAQAVNSPWLRAVQKDDGGAFAAAMGKRDGERTQMTHMQTLQGLLDSGQISPGPQMGDRLRTALAQSLGVGPDNPAAIQLAQNLIGKINQASYQNFKGLGAMSDADRMALEKAGPNWMMDKNALSIALKYQMRNMQHDHDALAAWENADDAARVRGYRSFVNKWKQDNPLQPLDVMGAISAQQNRSSGQSGPDPNAFFR